MGKFITNMNVFTEKLFCSPNDAQTAKSVLNLNLNFKFIVGNYTPWLPYSQTNWRSMPFSLCCCLITPCGKICVQTEEHDDPVISSRSVIFIPEYVSHNLRNTADKKLTSLWMHFRLTIFHSFNVFDFFEVPYIFNGNQAMLIRQYLETLIQMPRVLDLAGSLQLELTGMGIARELLAHAKLKPERIARLRYLNRLRPVFDQLDQIKPGKSFPSSKELAERVNLSQSRFLTLFHEITGDSPTKFIERKRYLEACELLLATHQSISNIATTLGYADAFHFSRKFKENAGMSPRAFRLAGS
jgi:AraC-like DNA-binding protein